MLVELVSLSLHERVCCLHPAHGQLIHMLLFALLASLMRYHHLQQLEERPPKFLTQQHRQLSSSAVVWLGIRAAPVQVTASWGLGYVGAFCSPSCYFGIWWCVTCLRATLSMQPHDLHWSTACACPVSPCALHIYKVNSCTHINICPSRDLDLRMFAGSSCQPPKFAICGTPTRPRSVV